jgi:hypothetical protein
VRSELLGFLSSAGGMVLFFPTLHHITTVSAGSTLPVKKFGWVRQQSQVDRQIGVLKISSE